MNKVFFGSSVSNFFRFLRRSWRATNQFWVIAVFEKALCGEGTQLGIGTQISKIGTISVGRRTVIGEDCWLNNNSPNSVISIGSFCLLGRRNFLNAGASISIGDYTLTGPDCMLLGSDHDWSDPMKPYIMTGSSSDQKISIGTNVWLGAGVKVMKGVSIGHGSVIGANALVTSDIPPFSLAYGAPAKVLKHYSFNEKRWVAASERSAEHYPSEGEYLEALRKDRTFVPPEAGGASLADY